MQEHSPDKPSALIPLLLSAVVDGAITLRKVGNEISFASTHLGITKTLTERICIAELNEEDLKFAEMCNKLEQKRAAKRAEDMSLQRSLSKTPAERRAGFKVVS